MFCLFLRVTPAPRSLTSQSARERQRERERMDDVSTCRWSTSPPQAHKAGCRPQDLLNTLKHCGSNAHRRSTFSVRRRLLPSLPYLIKLMHTHKESHLKDNVTAFLPSCRVHPSKAITWHSEDSSVRWVQRHDQAQADSGEGVGYKVASKQVWLPQIIPCVLSYKMSGWMVEIRLFM